MVYAVHSERAVGGGCCKFWTCGGKLLDLVTDRRIRLYWHKEQEGGPPGCGCISSYLPSAGYRVMSDRNTFDSIDEPV